jgi:hypothetical protein
MSISLSLRIGKAFFFLSNTLFELLVQRLTQTTSTTRIQTLIMVSSTDEDSSLSYSIIQNQLYGIIGPILIAIGSVGAILSCCVFSQKTMRKNPGSVYFIAFNANNFLSLLFGLLPPILSYTINVDPSAYNVPYCKIRFYTAIVLAFLSPSYLVLASIDRTLVTSTKALTRQRSTCRLAYYSISGVTLFSFLFYIHIFVRVNIQEIYPGFVLCFYDAGNYRTFVTYSGLVLSGLLPPLLMIVFAVRTLKNLRRVHIRPMAPGMVVMNTQRSKDRQLAIMLLAEILVYILFCSMTPIILIYTQSTQYQTKNTRQQALEQFLQSLGYFLSFIPVSINFYINLAVSKTFRQKTIQIFSKLYQFRPIQGGANQGTLTVVIANRSFVE